MHSKDEDETEGDVLFFATTHILLTESNTKNKLVKKGNSQISASGRQLDNSRSSEAFCDGKR